jgi:alkaline phosphatase D
MREVSIWTQSAHPSKLYFTYYPSGKPSEHRHDSALTISSHGNVAHFIAKELEPGTSYSYQILDAQKQLLASGSFTSQSLWQHREEPPNFSFATGSCAYINEKRFDRPGEPYGRGYEIFESIAAKKPRFMLWLGDNIYLREPDWNSRSGIYHRYSHFRALPELQELLKTTHHYAIWDDHDFGPNDADRSFIHKNITLEAFKDFWANESFGINGQPGITSHFSFNDLDFFLLDNRYYRSPNGRKTGKREILGEEQIEWLIDALVNSKASFKIVAIGGQVLSPAAVYENHATFAQERKKLLELIEAENIKNVVFLSGDRHKTELSRMVLKNGNILYDYTCSPLSSKAYDTSDEANILRLEGTHVSTQNFGLLSLKGPFKERKLSISTYDKTGALIWERTIERQ